MNDEKFSELIETAGGNLAAKLNKHRELAEHLISQQVEEMKEKGQAVELDDDDLCLLKAYRAFKCRSAPGKVFSWVVPDDGKIQIPESPSLLVDPREVVIQQ